MKKDSYVPKGIHFDKKLDDGFINIYEESLFVRCFEYSAVLVSELTGYRLYANIDKKNGFIFLECGFSKEILVYFLMFYKLIKKTGFKINIHIITFTNIQRSTKRIGSL